MRVASLFPSLPRPFFENVVVAFFFPGILRPIMAVFGGIYHWFLSILSWTILPFVSLSPIGLFYHVHRRGRKRQLIPVFFSFCASLIRRIIPDGVRFFPFSWRQSHGGTSRYFFFFPFPFSKLKLRSSIAWDYVPLPMNLLLFPPLIAMICSWQDPLFFLPAKDAAKPWMVGLFMRALSRDWALFARCRIVVRTALFFFYIFSEQREKKRKYAPLTGFFLFPPHVR